MIAEGKKKIETWPHECNILNKLKANSFIFGGSKGVMGEWDRGIGTYFFKGLILPIKKKSKYKHPNQNDPNAFFEVGWN